MSTINRVGNIETREVTAGKSYREANSGVRICSNQSWLISDCCYLVNNKMITVLVASRGAMEVVDKMNMDQVVNRVGTEANKAAMGAGKMIMDLAVNKEAMRGVKREDMVMGTFLPVASKSRSTTLHRFRLKLMIIATAAVADMEVVMI